MAMKKESTVSFDEGSLIFAKVKGYPGNILLQTFFVIFLQFFFKLQFASMAIKSYQTIGCQSI